METTTNYNEIVSSESSEGFVLAKIEVENVLDNIGEVTIVTNGAENLIPIEEQGFQPDPEHEYTDAEAQGYFSEDIGMARVKIMNGITICAAIQVDSQGRRKFEFRYQFSNGKFSPLITLQQADLYLAVKNDFIADNIAVKTLKNRVNKFLSDIIAEFLNIGIASDIPTIFTTLKILFKVQDKLPVYSDWHESSSRMEFYKDVVSALCGGEGFKPLMLNLTAKAYFPVTTDEMAYVASQFNMSATELAKKLYRYGFLYCPPSSKGYQTKIRIFSDEEAEKNEVSPFVNVYCILKLKYLSQQKLYKQ